jgi:hypothetical protein
MKSSIITTLVAVPLLSLSSMAFAAEPVLLSAVEMDGVTAGTSNTARVTQVNLSSIRVVQISAGNTATATGTGGTAVGIFGNASSTGIGVAAAGNQLSFVASGNFSSIRQR